MKFRTDLVPFFLLALVKCKNSIMVTANHPVRSNSVVGGSKSLSYRPTFLNLDHDRMNIVSLRGGSINTNPNSLRESGISPRGGDSKILTVSDESEIMETNDGVDISMPISIDKSSSEDLNKISSSSINKKGETKGLFSFSKDASRDEIGREDLLYVTKRDGRIEELDRDKVS